jgi:hypothetical protein
MLEAYNGSTKWRAIALHWYSPKDKQSSKGPPEKRSLANPVETHAFCVHQQQGERKIPVSGVRRSNQDKFWDIREAACSFPAD